MPSPRTNQRSICVFCASSGGRNPLHREAAIQLGSTLAQAGIRLVYGGAHVGLMGALADAALENGGTVTGVIPDTMVDREIAHRGLTELHIVGTMHERKARMADEANAFIALPGGFGTLEEFAEILTWAQLGIHTKPCVLLNVDGFYDTLLAFFERAVEEGFLRADKRALVRVAFSVHEALEIIEAAWKDSSEAVPAGRAEPASVR